MLSFDFGLPKKRLRKAVLGIAGGTALAQVLTMAFSPVLTRLYLPADFGIAASFGAFAGIFLVVGTLRLEYAMAVQQHDEDAIELFLTCIVTLGVTIAATILIMALGKEQLIQKFFPEHSLLVISLLPLAFFGASLYNVLSVWTLRKKDYSRVAKTRVYQGVSSLVLQLSLGLWNVGAVGLVVGQVSGLSAGVGTLAKALPDFRAAVVSYSFRKMKAIVLKYKELALFSTPGSLFNSIARLSPVLFLTALYDPVVAGLYALADRIVRLPLTVLGNSIAQVYLGETSDKISNGLFNDVYSLFRKAVGIMLLVSIVPLIVLVVGGPVIFSFVFGKKWLLAGVFAQLLAPQFAVRFAIAPFIQTLLMISKNKVQFLWEVLNLGLILVVFFVTHFLDLAPVVTIGSLSAAGTLSYMIVGLIVNHQLSSLRASVELE